MTTEEKAKAYDKALARARDFYNSPEYAKSHSEAKAIYAAIFPELKESEDERIRIWLLGYFEKINEEINKEDRSKILAWLEKQKAAHKDPRQECLDELLAADNIYQMAMNDAMVVEAKEKAISAISKLAISTLLVPEKQKTFCMWNNAKDTPAPGDKDILGWYRMENGKLEPLPHIVWFTDAEEAQKETEFCGKSLAYWADLPDEDFEKHYWFKKQKPVEWSEEDEKQIRQIGVCQGCLQVVCAATVL